MNYNIIEEERRKKGYTIEKMAQLVDMTKAGYEKMIKVKSMKVEILEKFAKEFGKPIAYFFNNSEALENVVQEPMANYGDDCAKKIHIKDLEIAHLKGQIDILKSLLDKK